MIEKDVDYYLDRHERIYQKIVGRKNKGTNPAHCLRIAVRMFKSSHNLHRALRSFLMISDGGYELRIHGEKKNDV